MAVLAPMAMAAIFGAIGSFAAEMRYWGLMGAMALLTFLAMAIEVLVCELRPWSKDAVDAAVRGFMVGFDLPAGCRMCVYSVCLARIGHLKQVTQYAPEGGWGSRRYGIADSKGVVGRVFRTKKWACWILKNDESLRARLVEKWSFSDKEAGRTRQDRKMFLAVPVLGSRGKPKGVIYLDSDKRDVMSAQLVRRLEKLALELSELI